MQIQINYKKMIVLFLNIVVFLLGYIFIFSYLNGDICTDHDHFYPLMRETTNGWFSTGRLVCSFFTYFYLIFLPDIADIHINDITTTIVPFVNASAISLSSIICLKIFYFFSNEKKSLFLRPTFFIFYPLIFLLMAILPTKNDGLDVFYFSSLHSVVRHYDHYFCYIFYMVFCYGLLNVFYKSPNLTTFIYFFNALILGVSTESLPIAALISTLFFILAEVLFKYKKIKVFCDKILFFIVHIFIFLIIGASIQFFNSLYIQGMNPYSDEIFVNYSKLMDRIIPFFITFVKTLIFSNIFVILVLVFFNVIIVFIKKEKTKIYILQFGIFIGFFIEALLFLYENSPQTYPISYLFEYYPFQTMFGKTLYVLLLLSGGYIINNFDLKKIQISVHIVVLICISSLIIQDFNEIKREYKTQTEGIRELRTTIYKADKMALTYNMYDGIAILPISFYEKYSQYTSIFRPRCNDADKKIRNEAIQLTKEELIQKESRIFSWFDKREKTADIDYLYYIKQAYGVELAGIKFVEDEIAYNEFYKRGGSFTEKELKALNYTKLKKQFSKKITEEEINNLIKEDSNSSYLYASKCRYYIKNNKPTDAIQECSNAIEIGQKQNEPFVHLCYTYRADAYKQIEKLSFAEKDYEFLLKKEPYYLKKMIELSQLYENKKEYIKAINVYQNIMKKFPYVPIIGETKTYHNKIAKLYFLNNDFDNALKNLNIAEEFSPDNVDYELRGASKFHLGKIDEAIDDYNIEKKINPQKTEEIDKFISQIQEIK